MALCREQHQELWRTGLAKAGLAGEIAETSVDDFSKDKSKGIQVAVNDFFWGICHCNMRVFAGAVL